MEHTIILNIKRKDRKMGLDICAYSNVRVSDEKDGLIIYSSGFDQCNMKGLEYKSLTFNFHFYFFAASYRGYGTFRRMLCKIANKIEIEELWENEDKEEYQNLPFFWLINFSDCEGYIGTRYCDIIYNDFLKYEELFMSISDIDDYYKDKYRDFKNAFNIASDNGLVKFC